MPLPVPGDFRIASFSRDHARTLCVVKTFDADVKLSDWKSFSVAFVNYSHQILKLRFLREQLSHRDCFMYALL